MLFGLNFDFQRVSTFQFMITLAISIVVIVIFAMYQFIYIWWLGRPMMKYLTARFNPGTGVIQEYIHENVHLKKALVKNGEFTDLERKGAVEIVKIPPNKNLNMLLEIIILTSLISLIAGFYFHWAVLASFGLIMAVISSGLRFLRRSSKKIYHRIKPIIAQSIISINGVETLMVWNVNPPLPERYLSFLNVLIQYGYNSIQEILSAIEQEQGSEAPKITLDSEIKTDTDKITISDFISLHVKIRDRNSIIVTPDDILSFSDKYLDEHAKKSVIEREVTVAQKRNIDSKYEKYAFFIVGFMVIGSFFLIAWKIYNGGK